MPTFFVSVILAILVLSEDANGFAEPSLFSARVSTYASPASRSSRAAVLFASSVEDNADNDMDTNTNGIKLKKATRNPLKKAYRIYTGYAKQLWRETDPSERSKIANDKVAQTVRDMQHVLTSEHETISSSSSGSKKCVSASEELLAACENMLSTLEEIEKENTEKAKASSVVSVTDEKQASPAKKEKKQRSILFGALMGAAVAGWVFSGNYIFTGLFCLVTILGQLEYYRMIMNTGVFPARRISVIGATSMFITVRFACFWRLEFSVGRLLGCFRQHLLYCPF